MASNTPEIASIQPSNLSLIQTKTRLNTGISPATKNQPRITNEELVACLADGMATGAIAAVFHVSVQAIRKRIAKLKSEHLIDSIQGNDSAGTPFLNTPEQLSWLNRVTIDLIKSTSTPATTKLQAIRRAEAQNELQLRVQRLIIAVNEARSFQRAVLEAITRLEPNYPELRENFVIILNRIKDEEALKIPGG